MVTLKDNGRTLVRHKVFVAVGDKNGCIGIGQKVKKQEVAAVSGATANAIRGQMRIVRGSWALRNVRTVPCGVKGRQGHLHVFIGPAPRGVGIQGHPLAKKNPQPRGNT